MTRIEQLRKIVANRQYEKVDGITVDVFSASSILACYERGSERTKKVIETAPLVQVAQLALKMTGGKK